MDSFTAEKPVVTALRNLMRGIASLDAPHSYPTPEGGVQLEWSTRLEEVTAEITAEGSLLLHATNVEEMTFSYVELEPNFDARIASVWIEEKIKSLSNDGA